MREFGSALRLLALATFLLSAAWPASATQSTRTYLDGTGATKQACTASTVTGAPAAGPCDTTGMTLFDVSGNPLSPALDGTDATGVSIATGGVGIRGWLSTLSSQLVNTLKVQLQAGSNVIGSVQQSGGPWTTTDGADGAVTPGTAALKSILGGLYYNGGTMPTPSAGQQLAAQADVTGRLYVNSPLTTGLVINSQPTVTVGTYAARQSLGGLLIFSGALPTLKGSIEEAELLVANGDTPVVAGTLYLFDANPSASTFSDHTSVVIASADIAKIVAVYSITTAADPSGAATPAFGNLASRRLVNAGNSSLWGVFVMNSATAIAGATDVTFRLKSMTY